jgi:hypothetical protein
MSEIGEVVVRKREQYRSIQINVSMGICLYVKIICNLITSCCVIVITFFLTITTIFNVLLSDVEIEINFYW